MKTYLKLLRIEYNHKIFDVFSDKNHKKNFLEVKLENNEEKYYCPDLKDYINLELIYNNRNNDILYLQNYTFKNILVSSGIITLLIANLQLTINMNNSNSFNLYKEYDNYCQIVVNEPRLISNNYYEKENLIIIINNDALTELGYKRVSFDDVRNTLAENNNIPIDYREITSLFIDRLEERLPAVDLTIFNENLKTLKFKVIPNDEWQKDEVSAFYTPSTNIITVKESYEEDNTLSSLSNKRQKLVGFHELSHTLNNAMLNTNQCIYKKFSIDNGYGISFEEGFNTILTDYLITDDWVNYFDKEEHQYDSYNKTAYIDYQLLRLLDDYDIYNYLNGNITELETKLKEYGLEKIIDALDVNLETNEGISTLDEMLLNKQSTTLLKYRINQLIDNGYDDLEIYDFTLNIGGLIADNISMCTDILNNRKMDWIFRTLEKEKNTNRSLVFKGGKRELEEVTNYVGDTIVNVYDDSNNLLSSKCCNNFCIMVSNIDDYRSYKLLYIAVSDNGLCYKDAFTDEIQDLISATNVISLDNLLVRYPSCNFAVNQEFLNSKQLDKYVADYLGVKINIENVEVGKYNIKKR